MNNFPLIWEIDEILLHAQQLVLANRPGGRDYKSVKNYIWNKQPLLEGDREFIYNKDDLITLRPGRETAWLDSLVESFLKLFPRRPIQYLFCSKVTSKPRSRTFHYKFTANQIKWQEATLKSEGDPNVRYFTKSRVDRVVNLLIIVMILTLLVLPVYALYHVSTAFQDIGPNTINAVCIGILLASTLLFSAVLSLFTQARRHEVLGASAAWVFALLNLIRKRRDLFLEMISMALRSRIARG